MMDLSTPRASRRWRRGLFIALVIAAAVWLQRGHLSEIPEAVAALGRSHPGWVLVAVAGSGLSYVMAAFAMVGTVQRRLPFGQALQVQVASGVTTLAAPAGLGAAGLNVWFLERVGVARAEAFAAALRNGVAGGVVHVVGLLAVLVWLPDLVAVDVSRLGELGRPILLGVAVVVPVLMLAVLAARRWQRERTRRAVHSLREAWTTTVALLRRWDRALPLAGGSFGLTLAYGVSLWASARAVGVPLDLPTAIAIELVVEALGALSATPGGVGVVEAASLQGLLLVGAAPASALGVVMLHRLVTFWLPALPGTLALRRLQVLFATSGPQLRAESRTPGEELGIAA